MNAQQCGVIGIVGGMGPQAGLALYDRILRHTEAATDQQHLPVILISFPGSIVDRTSFLEGIVQVNPAFMILEVIRKLESAGATVAGIACNTAHAPAIYSIIIEALRRSGSKLKLLNMPLETCRHLRDNYPLVRRVGLMTTNGTYKSGIYKKLLESWGYEVVIPNSVLQECVIHRMIYDSKIGIKANPHRTTSEVSGLIEEALSFFGDQKSDAIILGCTELSLVLTEATVNGILIVDSADALAKALIREATGCTENVQDVTDMFPA